MKRSITVSAIDDDPVEDVGPVKKKSKKQKQKQKPKSKYTDKHQPSVDPTYGQRTVIPDLEDADLTSDDQYEWEDSFDAMTYLKSVR